jgi:hypothetical protein
MSAQLLCSLDRKGLASGKEDLVNMQDWMDHLYFYSNMELTHVKEVIYSSKFESSLVREDNDWERGLVSIQSGPHVRGR